MDEYKKLLKELVSYQTVSSDPSKKDEFDKVTTFFSKLLQEVGFHVAVFEQYGHPIFYASYVANPGYKTCLIYGHYDVQPAARSDGWDSEPFEVVEKDEALFGRGTMDDKGQLLAHMVTIRELARRNLLRYNIIFLSEGEEEIGSPHIEQFIQDHTDLLKADFVVLSDGEIPGEHPSIELGFRGLTNGELTISVADNDLHSGLYGGVAPNAAHIAAQVIASLHDNNGAVAIDGFYDNVEPITFHSPLQYDLETYKKNTGAKAALTQDNLDIYIQVGLLPALNVVGMYSGYLGEGIKTSIPSRAVIKFNLRIVKTQTPDEVGEKLKKHIAKVLPSYVDYTFSITEKAYPAKIDVNNAYVKQAATLLEEIFGHEVFYKYVGGTEPVIAYFEKQLQIPQVLVPFANEDGHMHGINENFRIKNIEYMLEFSRRFFGNR